MTTRRKGRGRLSSIDLLPEHAEPAVQEALAMLADRSMDQRSILEALNANLAALDPPVAAISKSAFNRYSMRFAVQGRKLAEAREMAGAMAEKMDDLPEGDIGLLLGETIKTLINDVVVDQMLSGESPSIALLKVAAESLKHLEAGRLANAKTAQIAAKDFVRKAADAATDAAIASGLTDETTDSIRQKILGIK